jgi:hypothetical protein
LVTLRQRITTALSEIIGLPLWRATRVADMEMFDLGGRQSKLNRHGDQVDVGEWALHIQCPWRIASAGEIIVASDDRAFPEDETSSTQDFDTDSPSRCEARMAAWLCEHSSAPLQVVRVEADNVGGFKLRLDCDFVLEAFPASSRRGEYSEHWRLFRPLSEARHFVVTGYGVEK